MQRSYWAISELQVLILADEAVCNSRFSFALFGLTLEQLRGSMGEDVDWHKHCKIKKLAIKAMLSFLNRFSKKHQFLLSAVLGIVAIIISIIAIIPTKPKPEPLPSLKSILDYSDNGFDIFKIEFEPIDKDIVIQNIEIYYPSILNSESEKIVGKEWRALYFQRALEAYIGNNFNLPITLLLEPYGPYIDANFYCSINFSYIENGAPNNANALYKIITRIYGSSKVKIVGLEFLKYYNKEDNSSAIVDSLQCYHGIGNESCIENKVWELMKVREPILKSFIKVVEINSRKFISTIKLSNDSFIDNGLKYPPSFSIELPYFMANDSIQKDYYDTIDEIINDFDSLDSLEQAQIDLIIHFHNTGCLSKFQSIYSPHTNEVTTKECLNQWIDLNKRVKSRLVEKYRKVYHL